MFAIIRVDKFHGPEAPPEEVVTVTKVVWNQQDAEAEIARLNRQNAGKRCIYIWQITRMERRNAQENET